MVESMQICVNCLYFILFILIAFWQLIVQLTNVTCPLCDSKKKT